MVTAVLDYYERDQMEVYSKKQREETISHDNEIGLFELYYKKNNSLRYCNGSYYKWADSAWQAKYSEWLGSDDYKRKSFNLYYGNGVVD